MDIVKIGLAAGLLLVMFAQGLRLQFSDLLGFRREPGVLARSFLALDVLVPLAAVAVVAATSGDRLVDVEGETRRAMLAQ